MRRDSCSAVGGMSPHLMNSFTSPALSTIIRSCCIFKTIINHTY